MGRMFEVLRQADRAPHPREESPMKETPAPSAGLEPAEELPEGPALSYIEVGPKHSIEGSPDVLACEPVRGPLTPPPSPPRGEGGVLLPSPPRGEGGVLLPSPPWGRGVGGEGAAAPAAEARVVFRPLPSRPRPDVGRPRFAPELVAFHSPDLPVTEPYRNLLAALLPASGVRQGERCPVLVFTASQDGAGATTVLLNIAITAARPGRRRVAVVDANLRRPAVAERLGLEAAPGLREVLQGTATLDQALRPTEQPHLLALPAGLADAGAGTRFVAETTRSLLRHLRQRADLVLIDGPPWDGRPEAALLAAAADAVYLVLPEKDAETPQTDDLLQAICEYGARLAGCILAGR
jgi:Mrp family chromosome partitioning ATPase